MRKERIVKFSKKGWVRRLYDWYLNKKGLKEPARCTRCQLLSTVLVKAPLYWIASTLPVVKIGIVIVVLFSVLNLYYLVRTFGKYAIEMGSLKFLKSMAIGGGIGASISLGFIGLCFGLYLLAKKFNLIKLMSELLETGRLFVQALWQLKNGSSICPFVKWID